MVISPWNGMPADTAGMATRHVQVLTNPRPQVNQFCWLVDQVATIGPFKELFLTGCIMKNICFQQIIGIKEAIISQPTSRQAYNPWFYQNC